MEINNFFTFENIVLASTALVNFILFTVIFVRRNKSRNTYFFLGFILSVMSWVIGVLFFRVLEGYHLLLVTKFVYFAATLIPFFIVLFTQTFPKRDLGFSRKKTIVFILFPLLFLILTIIPDAIIKNVIVSGDYRSVIFGPFYYFYFLYIVTYFLIGIILMIKGYFKLKGIERNQIEIIFLSILVSSFIGMATNLIMPSFNNFTLFWVGPFFSGYMVLTIGYAMIKYGLFNIKLIATEFAALSTWILMFVKLTLDKNPTDRLIDSVVLIILIISGLYVIRSVTKEIELREKDDKLVNDMAGLNQTLEKTNVRLKELDQKKSEFMSLATHQLRAPLTAMRGYYSMIQDGTFGKINNPELEDVISKISRSTTDLTMIVEDYLNISRIEQGRMQYNFVSIDLADIVKDVVKEVTPTVAHAGIKLNLKYDDKQKYMVSVDQGKIKQVVFNIIDNSIKYTPKGSVDVSINKTENNKVVISVKDTGVGIKATVLPQLFQKFTRAPDASDTNILGTGLGLYVADQILKAHDGRAWAESEGQGNGSQFYIELSLMK
jgi:signal transduction histidine kinase